MILSPLGSWLLVGALLLASAIATVIMIARADRMEPGDVRVHGDAWTQKDWQDNVVYRANRHLEIFDPTVYDQDAEQ